MQAEPSPKTPKKTVAFEVDQLQKLTESAMNLEVNTKEEEVTEIVGEGKIKIEPELEKQHEETSSTLTGKLKKRITKKVPLHY